ncbi:hypothetical protein BVRB_6g132220 [Beta vulgaris subsp. vulgaris]|nr:hypothetical protein BVRB_6g132220 [Beta vulgaris subsp. vulgaris]
MLFLVCDFVGSVGRGRVLYLIGSNGEFGVCLSNMHITLTSCF